MNPSAIAFFILFAGILWGGLAVCLGIAMKSEKKN